jgi:tryptophan 2,3-dioxygenase
MSQAQQEMEEAVADWLRAYENHKRYLAATNRLFTVFTRSWGGSPRYIAAAFTDFRSALLRNSGYKPVEVNEVFPAQKSESK